MTSDISDHDSDHDFDHDELDLIEWEAEENEMAMWRLPTDLWFDYCVRKLDPSDPVYWDDEPDPPAD